MYVNKIIFRFAAFTQKQINNKTQYLKYINQVQNKKLAISPIEFKQLIQLDFKFDAVNFKQNLKTFKQYLKGNYYLNQPQLFYDTLFNFGKFQKVQLELEYIQYIYWLINSNIHHLNSKALSSAYLFLSKSDPLIHQSIIYEYFVKYYVKNSSQLMKIKFKINSSMNIGEMAKKIFSRLLIKEYGKKTPSYDTDIRVPKDFIISLLQQLFNNKNTSESLFAKKLHYQLFTQIKQLYEDQMKQNLYHDRKQQLFTLIETSLHIWSYDEIQIIKQENLLIRQLYMKLLLASQGKLIFSNSNNLLIFYKLLTEKYDQQQEDISKVISYLKLYFIDSYQQIYKQLDFVNKIQYLLIIFTQDVIENIKSNDEHKFPNIMTYCFNMIQQSVSSFYAHIHFAELIKLKKYYPHYFEIHLSKTIIENKELMSLEELLKLCFQYIFQKQKLGTILNNIINLQSSTIITSQHILNLLKIINSSAVEQHLLKQRQILRNFLFKYISDHHNEFPIDIYLEIYQIIKTMKDSKDNFDTSGFYKENIFQELKEYNQQKNIEERILSLSSLNNNLKNKNQSQKTQLKQ